MSLFVDPISSTGGLSVAKHCNCELNEVRGVRSLLLLQLDARSSHCSLFGR